jgi:hypothetical protein
MIKGGCLSLNRAYKILSVMIYHHVLNIMNEAGYQDAEVEQLMGVTTHIKGTRFTSLRNSSHIKASSEGVDYTTENVL